MSGNGDRAARLRAEMVTQLRERGRLCDPRVAAVLGQAPRHIFVPGAELPDAYADRAVVTHHRDGVPTSSASQPAVVAMMLEQLRPPPGGCVLEIGAGTGYNAALLAALVGPSGRVVTIDIDPEVASEARGHLAEAGVTNVEVICGDGAAGWAASAPYDGIIVTAGASDLAPAWTGQLAPGGRLVLPLSIRGVQHCVAFTWADGTQADRQLRSVSVRGGGFMPLAGAMANSDIRLPVPRHPGVYVLAAQGTKVDTGLVADTLDDRRPRADLGITAPGSEVAGSLRRWLAFGDHSAASLAYLGPPEGADASGVPPVLSYTLHGVTRRSSPCILGPAGLALLDLAAPRTTVGDAHRTVLELATRACGEANQEAVRLGELVTGWEAANRPGPDRLRIDAYPSGTTPPGIEGMVHPAQHATFVVASS
jgi:protein-L-isoaspartate(D-aspartate) O-methyltransferase